MGAAFERYIGIDYSGAETCESGLKGLRVSMGDRATEPRKMAPPPSPRKNWTRTAIARWLVERLSGPVSTLVGIDHGFSFPLKYYEKYDLAHDWRVSWTIFKNIGQQMRPVPTSISFVKASAETVPPAVVILAGDGSRKCALARNPCFISTCRAPSPKRRMPLSLWLRFIRRRVGDRVHFWPFDGWKVPPGKSAVVEVYPALWSHGFPRDGRNSVEQDAYAG